MTITLTREEAQQVLYALADAAGCVQENYQPGHMGHGWGKEIEILRAALAKTIGEQQ
jgi:crotonobetainyl-CoA:carnitine CoA-transferase CaiB-like acyl-CoA transferase